MTRYFPLLKTRIVLRTMIFGAGTPIQDAIDDAGGMRFMCMRGTTPENVDVWKRVTLEGEGADVVTSCDRGKVIEN